jgi:hypothetical protein
MPRSVLRKKKVTTSKVLIWVITVNALLMMWCSYVLAWFDKVSIAESLSSTVTEVIVGTTLGYLITKTIENVSKYGSRLNKTTVEQELNVIELGEDTCHSKEE